MSNNSRKIRVLKYLRITNLLIKFEGNSLARKATVKVFIFPYIWLQNRAATREKIWRHLHEKFKVQCLASQQICVL